MIALLWMNQTQHANRLDSPVTGRCVFSKLLQTGAAVGLTLLWRLWILVVVDGVIYQVVVEVVVVTTST